MQTSSNYGLKLMEGTDNVKRQDFVDNFTKIDTEMKAIENAGYPIVEATGTNAYIGATARIKSLGKGTKLTLFVGANANGNCSLNLNSYGSKNIKDSNGNIVINMKANIPYNLCYNGTDFILQGKGGGGNLIPKYLLAGYYGEGDNGRVDGTMANNGAVTSTLTAGTSYTIPAGYHNGSGKITANNLASQTSATATAGQILSGQTAWVNGSKITGSMPNMPFQTNAVSVGSNGMNKYFRIPKGAYVNVDSNGVSEIVASATQIDSNIVASNIISGKSICGVDGTATSDANATAKHIYRGRTAYVNGQKITGTRPIYECNKDRSVQSAVSGTTTYKLVTSIESSNVVFSTSTNNGIVIDITALLNEMNTYVWNSRIQINATCNTGSYAYFGSAWLCDIDDEYGFNGELVQASVIRANRNTSTGKLTSLTQYASGLYYSNQSDVKKIFIPFPTGATVKYIVTISETSVAIGLD